jgi:microcystin-dependent protein
MRKIIPQTGGHPLRLNDVMLLQGAVIDIATALAGTANAGNSCVLQGCTVAGNNIGGGWIYFNGEIYETFSIILPSPSPGQSLYWNVVETTEDPVSLSSPYTVKYQDLVFKGVHKKRTMVPVWATSGTIADVSLPRITTAMVNGGLNPIGGIMMWNGIITNFFSGTGLGIFSMTGWALCNGQNGTTDLRSRFIVGYDPGVTDFNALGKTGGGSFSTLTIANLPVHNHPITFNAVSGTTGTDSPDHSHNVDVGNQGSGQRAQGQTGTPAGGTGTYTSYGANSRHAHSFSFTPTGSVGNTGSGTAFENRPPFYTLAYIQRIS